MDMHPRIRARRVAVDAARRGAYAAAQAEFQAVVADSIANLRSLGAVHAHPDIPRLISFWQSMGRIMQALDPARPDCEVVLDAVLSLLQTAQCETRLLARTLSQALS
ncbi:hypothetical protein [Azospirillum canadense]|uniref:hypothetical protein n=1 Tax=Azospirillum canadense TaxID=403962 RepID=UPI0022260390|nr:hypothetical protein [Azospirillum canadense]MCW2240618.1 hypothetical protein [Azospirillum canadense]